MDTRQLGSRLEALRASGGFSADVVTTLGAFIERAPDHALFRMSPLRYGRDQELPILRATDLFLHATRAGLLDFTWGVVCPGCAGFITTPSALRHLHEARYCPFCQVDVPVDLETNTEVTFTVSPVVRRTRYHDPEQLDPASEGLSMFFSSSLPSDSCFHDTIRSHPLSANRLAKDESIVVDIDLEPGRYLLFAPASHGVVHITAGDGPSSASVDVLADRVIPDQLDVAGRAVRLAVRNSTGRGAVVALYPDPIPPPELRPPDAKPPGHRLAPHLTAKALINTQSFRDLFGAESLPGDGGIELRSMTLLFTDLASSTALYEEVGDLDAYSLVREHFDVLRGIVAAGGGAVVKTIGDAIMASFADAEPGMASAASMLRAIKEVGGGERLKIKIGLHTGPCIAVELNDRLDYFGRTVNIAARVQGLAAAQEIVCTESAWESRGVQDAAKGLRTLTDRATLKGIDGEVAILRLT